MRVAANNLRWGSFLRCAGGLALLTCQTLVAEEGPWAAREWQMDDGLPDNNVSGVVQTAEGYLWIATDSGLARFDGLRFQRVPLPMPSGRAQPLVRALTVAGGETLWLALEGGLVVSLDSRATNLFTAAQGLPSFRPLTAVADASGAAWVSYSDGSVCRITSGQVTRFTARDGLAGTGGCWLTVDGAGRLWFAKAGRIGWWRNDKFEVRGTVPEDRVRLAPARAGGVWLAGGGRLWHCTPQGGIAERGRLPAPSAAAEISVLLETSPGALWIGTAADGLFHLDGTNWTKAATSHGEIRCLTWDREGSLWAGTGGGGLNRIRSRVLRLHGAESGIPSETVRSVCADGDGGIWITCGSGALARFNGAGWQRFGPADGWPDARATCATSGRDGSVWIGTYRGDLHRWRNGTLTALDRSAGFAGGNVRALLVDRAGDLWVGQESSNCLQRLRGGVFHTFLLPPGRHTPRALAEDAAGTLWLGTSDGLLFRVQGNGLVDETPLAFTPRPIRSLHTTSDGSLWIGYAGAGVGRRRAGAFARVEAEQGLHDNYICGIADDGAGSLWFSSNRGLFQARQADLEAVLDGHRTRVRCITYGRDESLPNLQGSYGYSPGPARDPGGRLWFPTRTGLAEIAPARAHTRLPAVPVCIERVALDGKPLMPSATGRFQLPPRHRRLEIEFGALTYVAPESVQFRHWLENWDEDWSEPQSQRSAAFGRLPAGNYRFRLAASSQAGEWTEPETELRFEVPVVFWQTAWFRGGVLVLFTGLVIAVVRYVSWRRLRRQVARLEQERALQRERERIARDIHDELGASLTQISLLGKLAEHDLHEPAKAAGHVARLSAMARQGVKAVDEIVWAVNPRNDTLAHLLDYAGQYAVDFLRTAGIRCRVDFPGTVPPHLLTADVRHNLFMVVKEALNNVAKHADAREVWLRARVAAGRLTLAVEDDGHGFAAGTESALSDGLRNMQRRLEEAGGRCRVESQPGTGTRVIVELELAPAGRK